MKLIIIGLNLNTRLTPKTRKKTSFQFIMLNGEKFRENIERFSLFENIV